MDSVGSRRISALPSRRLVAIWLVSRWKRQQNNRGRGGIWWIFLFFVFGECVFWLYYNIRIWDGVGDVFRSMYWVLKTGNREINYKIRRAVRPQPPHSISILFFTFQLVFFPRTSWTTKCEKKKKAEQNVNFSSCHARARERLTTLHRNLVVLFVNVRVLHWWSVNGSPSKCDFLRPRTSVADDTGLFDPGLAPVQGPDDRTPSRSQTLKFTRHT